MSSVSAFKKRLALPVTSWQICLLAIICGFAAALLLVLFQITIENIQHFYSSEAFQYISIDWLSRFQIPILAVVFILLLSRVTGYQYIRSGIPFVLHRLKVAYGAMPFRNTLNQFFGGAFAIASGFSVGKEGPSVHLGSASASFLASRLHLPYNTIRTLSACGIAAGISAVFNTPIAAVVFVMEVILREYKVHIFIPVMLASIVGSVVTSSLLGNEHSFTFFAELELDLIFYPLLIIFGAVLGTFASGFNHYLAKTIERFQHWHIFKRLLVAALITGALSHLVPNGMLNDIGSIQNAIDNQWQFQVLAVFLLVKVLMTIAAIGLGIPGGVIGPILMIGALTGMCGSFIAGHFLPAGEHIASDLAILGMAGFMAATLNAPLAALLAVVELSRQLEIIVPAMIVITVACLVAGQMFGNRSIFIMQLNVQKLAYRKSPVENSLQGIGVLGSLRNQLTLTESADNNQARYHLANNDNNALIINQYQNHERQNCFEWLSFDDKVPAQEIVVRQALLPLSSQATLAEAYLTLKDKRQGGVYIYQRDQSDIIGVILFRDIQAYLQEGKIS